MYMQFESGILPSRLKMNEKLIIGKRKLVEETFFINSTGAYIEPSIGVRFKPIYCLHLSLGCGYEIDAWEKMKLSSNYNRNARYHGNDKIRWNGFRLYAGII